MSIGFEGKPRYRRGCRSITQFYNQFAAEPVDEKQMYKMIARGTVAAGHDGSILIAEESAILRSLRRAAGATIAA
jgi:hypothetical protein